MQIEFHVAPLFAIARVSGELDLSSAEKFRSLIDQELRRSGVPNVVVNLRNLSRFHQGSAFSLAATRR